MLFDMLVVGGNCLTIVFAPFHASGFSKLFREGTFESGR
jgi:hypothetical protein